jgi:hypothetical protein
MGLAADERRFYSNLGIVSGPALTAGGWLAAFTLVGAALIVLGGFVALGGTLVLPTWRRLVIGSIAVAACWWPLAAWFVSLAIGDG